MESKDNSAQLTVTADVTSSLYEDDALRDGSVELEKARGEFRLGRLEAATKLLDDLARRLEPKLNCTDCLDVKANYAASRVLNARIYEERQLADECQKALAEAMATFDGIAGSLKDISTRALGDYGIALEMLGRHQDAVKWLQKALEKGLDTQPTFHYLGLAQKALGQWAEAASSLTDAEKRNQEDVVAIEALGDVLAATGDSDGAAEAYWRASVGYLIRGNPEPALRLIDASSRLRSENAKDLGLRGTILWRLGRCPEALQLMDQAIKIAPTRLIVRGQNLVTALWRVRGRVLLQMERWEEAAEAFAEAIVQDPANTVALAGRAKALVQLDRSGEALPLLEQAITREPKNVGFLVDKALVLRNLGQLEEALKTTEQALLLDHNSILALHARAEVLQLTKRFEEAACDFEMITELDPSQFDAWLDRADALRSSDHVQEALDVLNKAANHFSNLSPAEAARLQTALGRTLRDNGEPQKARAAFAQSYAINPNLSGFLDLVDTLRQVQDYARAFADIENYLAKHAPAPIEVLVRKARLLCDIGEFGQAYEILLPIETKDASVFDLRGRALQNQSPESGQKALAEYEQAAALQPDNLWYKNHVASALRMLGQEEDAAQHYLEIAGKLAKCSASLNAYDLWLLGWCYLCLRRCGEAIRYLTAVPTSGTAASFPQFDLALAFLCDGRSGLAERSYSDALKQVQEKNCMRQRGLLTVAIRDLEVTSRLGQIPQEAQEASTRILKQLREASREAPLYSYQKAS